MIANKKNVKLCRLHADAWMGYWQEYVIGCKVVVSYTSDCEWCIERKQERCPTCNKFLHQ